MQIFLYGARRYYVIDIEQYFIIADERPKDLNETFLEFCRGLRVFKREFGSGVANVKNFVYSG